MTQTTATAPAARTAGAFLTTGPVWLAGAVAATAGALAAYGYGAAAQALSVPMRAASW